MSKVSRLSIKETLVKYHSIEIDLILSYILGKSKEFLYMNGEYKLSSYQVKKLSSLAKRRMDGEPMAYVLGYKDFYGLRFKVDKNVLVPRPETELLVDRVVQGLALRNKQATGLHYGSKIKILDVGTGSGCIAISIAKEVMSDKLQVTASDISSAALSIARQNAKSLLGKNYHTTEYRSILPIRFIKSDLLKSVRGDFDIIIANLPYLWQGSSDDKQLKREPKKALYTKEKGLMQIRRLLEQIAALKRQPKLVYLEFDPRQKNELHHLIKKILPSSKVKFYKDFNNFWRCVEIKP